MVHRSKKDVWIVVLIFAAVAGPLIAAVVMMIGSRPDPSQALVLLAVSAGIGGLLVVLAVPISYEITPSTLIIRSGVLRHRIPLESIEGIRPTWNPLSAPAWSLDRLRIDYRRGDKKRFALISPQNKTAFLAEVAHSEPGLTLVGPRLVRAPGR